ncbi:hypothetical protein [Glaciimonas soli]|uniref:Uncharacterized protein n=1 Tax=Glaciimonas soli TaxID=2590999 RepID=A0A843YPF0_9BURK|nr:hypothetical protein [Glaciimonas soli]MQQ99260.1 hypothetical protein [Glaciimonas soli]
MKQTNDKFTVDAFDKRGRGRPLKHDAKTSAQRQKEYRQRNRFNLLDLILDEKQINVTRNEK